MAAKKNMLKITNSKTLSCQTWDDFVEETYGRKYSFQQQDGCKDRGIFRLSVPVVMEDYEDSSTPEELTENDMGVSFKTWLERDPHLPFPSQKYDWELKMLWFRNFYPNIHMIANDLHARGLMEPGEYIIFIDW